jgi:TPM domain
MLAVLIAAPDAPPRPSAHLFDPGQFLSADEQAKVSQSLDAYAKESKHEVIVYIDRTAGGQPAASWCRETFNRWRAERPSLDNGVAVFLFTEDRTAIVTPGEHLIPDFTPERSDTICLSIARQGGEWLYAVKGSKNVTENFIDRPPGTKAPQKVEAIPASADPRVARCSTAELTPHAS